MPRALPAALLLLFIAVSHAAVTQVVVGASFTKVFDPVDVTITVGDTIFWSWTGFFHNVVEVSNATTCNITGLVGGPTFCSINPSNPAACTDADWLNATNPPFSYNHTFTSPGTYHYICTVHCAKDGMRGSVTVLPPTTPPASTAPPGSPTPAATTAAPTTPTGGTTVPPTTVPFVNYTDPYAMTSLMPQYDNCHVYNVNATVYANPVTPSAVLFWSVDTANNRIRFALNCYGRGKRIGFCAVGFKTGIIKAMLGDTDVNLGFWNGTAAYMTDYHIGGQRPNPFNPAQDVCLGGNGVCTDAALGCADNVAFESGAVTFDGEKATFRWSRPLDSGDAKCDRPLTAANASVLVAARSYNPTAPALQFHDIFYSAYDSFSFVDAPDCPNNCSEVGTCNKGCCVCPPGTGGLDCSLGSIVRPIQLAALIAPGYYPFSHKIGRVHQQDRLTLYWTTYQLDGYYNNATAIELALEFRHDNPSDAWVAFGFGKEMRHSDVLIAQGADLSIFGDYTIGTGKSCCGVGSSIEPDDSIGGQNSILSARSDYDAARGVWVIKYLRLLETGDPLDKKISLGWNHFIWAVGRDNLLSKAGQHGKFNRWFGRFNVATGQLHNALDQRIIHGSLMFIAMAVLIPLGATLARYGKLKLKGVWFHGHRLIMLVALILEIAAFITAVQFVKPGSQFITAHGRLGIVIVILSLAQPFIGWATDIFYNPNNTRPKPFPDLAHWIIGWTVVILVLAQCTLGLHDIGARTALHVLWDIYLVLVVVGLVGAALYFWFKYRYYGFRGGAIAVDDEDHK